MIDEAPRGKMNGALQFNRKMEATAMSEKASQMNVTPHWGREVGCAPVWNSHLTTKVIETIMLSDFIGVVQGLQIPPGWADYTLELS